MGDIIKNLDLSVLSDALLRVVPALICITLHELSHGFVAYKLGDDTAKNAGRLTLNPIKHIDIMGLIMMLVFRFGWAKPVPVNMNNFKNPKRGMAITALAGPVTNLLISAVMLVVYGIVFVIKPDGWELAKELILTTAWLSIALAIFNIIPIPPLDGSKVVFSLLNDEMYKKLMHIERFGMIILIVVLWSGVFGNVLGDATGWVFDKLFYIAEGVYTLLAPLAG